MLRWGHGWTTAVEAVVTARAAARRALDIDDSIAEGARDNRSLQMMHERDWTGRKRSFCRAIELAPDYPTSAQLVRQLPGGSGPG